MDNRYKDKLGFHCLGTWHDPPVYAIVGDDHRIHFRLADPPRSNPDKYADELLDAYLFVDDADALHAEYVARGVEFTRVLGDTAWHSREFVVKDCDGRLLAFGADPSISDAWTSAAYPNATLLGILCPGPRDHHLVSLPTPELEQRKASAPRRNRLLEHMDRFRERLHSKSRKALAMIPIENTVPETVIFLECGCCARRFHQSCNREGGASRSGLR